MRGRAVPVAVAAILGVLAAPVPSSAVATTELRVLTFNIWHSDSTGGLGSVADEIRASGANVVALQETGPGATRELAGLLGWDHTESGGDVDVLSSSDITREWATELPGGTTAVSAHVAGVLVYSLHLDYRDYGPYNACIHGESEDEILAAEAQRVRQATAAERWATSTVGLPQIVAGDFNTPSHLDWTERTRATHCDSAIAWPATKVFADNGWRDSYRDANPDEAARPGNTWSPTVKWHDDAETVPEPQDRIDLILYEGDALSVAGSAVTGGGEGWPSDHYAVLSTFRLG